MQMSMLKIILEFLEFLQKKIKKSKIIIDKGFERSEVADAYGMLKGGEVSMPPHLQIKYTANQVWHKSK